MNDYREPGWWRRSIRSCWLIFVLVPFAVVLVVYGALSLQGIPTLTELLTYAVVTSMLVTVAYYIRKLSSPNVWRIVWILVDVGVIGFPVSIALAFLLVNTSEFAIGSIPLLLLSFGIAVVVGALLGDRLGKRRDYQPLG